jgi:hypothetical protein
MGSYRKEEKMNIFILDYDHEINAQYLVDRHILKMPIEACQLLSNAIADNLPVAYEKMLKCDMVYPISHFNHPCSKWVRHSFANFKWLIDNAEAMFQEYYFRYDKPYFIHKSHKKLFYISTLKNGCIIDGWKEPTSWSFSDTLSPFVSAMPEQYKVEDSVESYRNYYRGAKQHLYSWKKRNCPEWL